MATQLWKRLVEFVEFRVLHIDDTPHRIALGVAIGFFVAWTPTISVQMILAVGLAALMRANKAVPVPIVWISNPFTMVPIYYTNYLVGAAILGRNLGRSQVARAKLAATVHQAQSFVEMLGHLLEASFWRDLATVFVQLGSELWLGSVIVGLVLAAVSYPVTKKMVIVYRARRRSKLQAKRNKAIGGKHRPEVPHA